MGFTTDCMHQFYIVHEGKKHLVRCGKCTACRLQQTMQWIHRFESEARLAQTAMFGTMTYTEDNLPMIETADENGEIVLIPTLDKDHLKKYMHVIRQHHKKSLKKWPLKDWPKLIYFAPGEYGSVTRRPHYHFGMLNIHPKVIDKLPELWKHGQTEIGPLKSAGISYIMKDMMKQFGKEFHPEQQKPFRLISNGVGQTWIDLNKKQYRKDDCEYLRLPGKIKGAMPSYYKNKLYPDKKVNQITQDIKIRKAENEKFEKQAEAIKNGNFESIESYQDFMEERKEKFRRFLGRKPI